MNIQMLMKQANEMQRKIAKAEKEIASKKYEKTLGGAVKLVMNGDFKIESLEINDEILEKDNKEFLEDMLLTGINELIDEIKKEKDELMGSLTGGVKFPGGF